MDNREKLELINTLAARLGWLIRAYSKREAYDNWDIASAELAYLQFEDDDSPEGGVLSYYQGAARPAKADEFAATMRSMIDTYLAFVRLDYNFIEDKLVLEIASPRLSPEAIAYTDAPERLLEFFDEADIRRAFADHEAAFLKLTNTTAKDWHLVDVRLEG